MNIFVKYLTSQKGKQTMLNFLITGFVETIPHRLQVSLLQQVSIFSVMKSDI